MEFLEGVVAWRRGKRRVHIESVDRDIERILGGLDQVQYLEKGTRHSFQLG